VIRIQYNCPQTVIQYWTVIVKTNLNIYCFIPAGFIYEKYW